MKKVIFGFIILMILILSFFLINSYAVSLDTINIDVDKSTIRPGEEVNVVINFGQNLAAGDFNVFYDNNLFDFVSNQTGTANVHSDRVTINYYELTNQVDKISLKFKAKDGITTSNPTEFTLTASDIVNTDSTIFFEDIVMPIIKNVIVEPEYVDYIFKLEPQGNVKKEQINEMKLSYYSPMGRYYANARLIAEVSSPGNAIVKLLGTDTKGLEHDIIQSGWGDAQGYNIGGKDYAQVLNVRGIFTDVGDYTITLKLIDRSNSDSVIAQNSFNFTISDIISTPSEQQTQVIAATEQVPTVATVEKFVNTGKDNYIPIVLISFLVIGTYIYYIKIDLDG